MRQAHIVRATNETDIDLTLTLLPPDRAGTFEGSSGIGFLDHMLAAVALHGHMNLLLRMTGDLYVDGHHSVEDLGIVFGTAFAEAAGDRAHLCRYGTAYIPMDESLSRCVLDISGRPYLVYDAKFDYPAIGTLETALIREFFYAFSMKSGVTLHICNLYGGNDHHKAESMFKAFARALGQAACLRDGDALSTKGTLDA